MRPDDPDLRVLPCPASRDAEAIAFLRRVFYVELGFSPDPALDRDFAGLVAHYRRGRGELWIADRGGVVVATTAVLDLGGDDAELKRMFVDRALRGAGLGKRLLDAARAHAKAAGFRRLVLDSKRDMHAALALYRGAGFREIPDYNQNRRADVFMALEL